MGALHSGRRDLFTDIKSGVSEVIRRGSQQSGMDGSGTSQLFGGLMSQKSLILEHLRRHGEINIAQAWRRYKCYRLSARIKELRDEGHEIDYIRDPDEPNRGRYVYGGEENVRKDNSAE